MKKQFLDTKQAIELMEKEAHNLSRFDGELVDYVGEYDDYTGDGDDLLDFEGDAKSFVSELRSIRSPRIINLTVQNPNTTAEEFYLFGGLKNRVENGTVPNGLIYQTGANNSVAGNALTVSCSPTPFELLRRFLAENPARIVAIKMSSTTPLQIEEPFDVEVQSPFNKSMKTFQINPASYQNENTYRDGMVTIVEAFQVDAQTQVAMKVLASSTLRLSLYFGGVMNIAKAMHKKAAKAHGNLSDRPALNQYYAVNNKAQRLIGTPSIAMIGG